MEKTDIRFCEGRIQEYSTSPWISEYYNTISSLCMFFFGGIFALRFCSFYFAYWLICLNGIGSFFYHATFFNLAKQFDELTMILCLCLVIFKCTTDYRIVKLLLLFVINWSGNPG